MLRACWHPTWVLKAMNLNKKKAKKRLKIALQSLNLYGKIERKFIFLDVDTQQFLPKWTEQNRPYVSFHMVYPGYLSIFFNGEKCVYVGTVLVHNGQFPQKINGKSVNWLFAAGVSGNSRFPRFPGIQASNFPSHPVAFCNFPCRSWEKKVLAGN